MQHACDTGAGRPPSGSIPLRAPLLPPRKSLAPLLNQFFLTLPPARLSTSACNRQETAGTPFRFYLIFGLLENCFYICNASLSTKWKQ